MHPLKIDISLYPQKDIHTKQTKSSSFKVMPTILGNENLLVTAQYS